MSPTGTFHIVVRGRALRSLNFTGERSSDSEISGSIGNVHDVAVIEGTLLEVKGTNGAIRLSLPLRLLERLVAKSAVESRG